MSEHDKKAVEANFSNWKTGRAGGMSDSDAFERYAVELEQNPIILYRPDNRRI